MPAIDCSRFLPDRSSGSLPGWGNTSFGFACLLPCESPGSPSDWFGGDQRLFHRHATCNRRDTPPPRSDHIPRGGFPAGGSPQAGLIQRNVKILHEYRTRRKSSRAGFGKPFRDESTGLFGHGQVGGCAPVGRKCERRRGLGPEGRDSQAQEKERPEPTRTRPSVGIFRRTPAFATVRVHRLGARLVQRCAIFFKRAVVDLPATTGRMITRPPACSTAARSA